MSLSLSEASREKLEVVYRAERFRIGWYDSAKNLDTPARLALAGFDTVMPYSTRRTIDEVQEFLREAETAGIGVHLEIPRARVADSSGGSLEEYIRSTAESPAVLDWYLYDEPEWRRQSRPRLLNDAYSRVKAVDPGREVCLVFMLPALSRAYRGAMDSLWIDYYPVGRRSRQFTALQGGAYADRMKAFGRRAERYGLPLTLVLQGFGENEAGEHQFWRRLPTPAETRYMFWAALLGRPRELIYWTLYRTREEWLQESLLPVVRDFRGRFPDTVEYHGLDGFKISGGRADSILLGNGHGGLWLVVLSRQIRTRTLEIVVPEGFVFRDEPRARTVSREVGPFGVVLLEIVMMRPVAGPSADTDPCDECEDIVGGSR